MESTLPVIHSGMSIWWEVIEPKDERLYGNTTRTSQL